MKKPYTFISKDRELLLEMLSLRLIGWTFVSLAKFYHCDRQSVRYHCRRFQIFPIKTKFVRNSNEVFDPIRISHQVVSEIVPTISSWVLIDGERINTGKSYKDYLKGNSPYKRS